MSWQTEASISTWMEDWHRTLVQTCENGPRARGDQTTFPNHTLVRAASHQPSNQMTLVRRTGLVVDAGWGVVT